MAEAAVTTPLNHHPNDPGPKQGSNKALLLEENKAKRREFGAGIGFAAEEKIRSFVFEMSFATKDATKTTINIYQPHKDFITKLLEITEGDAHVMPTAKAKDATDGSTQSPILSPDAFPKTTFLHGKFFDKNIFYNEKTQRTVIKIKHQILMKEPIHTVKRKMLTFLQTNKMWLKNGDLDAVEMAICSARRHGTPPGIKNNHHQPH